MQVMVMVLDAETGMSRALLVRDPKMRRAALESVRDASEVLTLHVLNSKRTALSDEERERLWKLADEQLGPAEPEPEAENVSKGDEAGKRVVRNEIPALGSFSHEAHIES